MQEVAYRKDFKRGKLWWIEETAAAAMCSALLFMSRIKAFVSQKVATSS